MVMSTSERTALREELVSQGYSWGYIAEWQPKITLYRHTEMKNPKGEVVSEAGTKVEGLPGNPDYITRKARQGLLQWPPGDTCTCKWCLDKRKSSAPVSSEESTVSTQTYSIGRGKRRMRS